MEAAENEEEFSPDGKRAELKGRNRKWDRKNPRESNHTGLAGLKTERNDAALQHCKHPDVL